MCLYFAHHVCRVGANHIKGLAKCREVHFLLCVRQGGYPVSTPCFCLYALQSPELTLSQKIKAKLQNPDLLELCHSVPKEVVQLGEAWGGLCFSLYEMLGSCPGSRDGSLFNRPDLLASFYFLPASHAADGAKIHPC